MWGFLTFSVWVLLVVLVLLWRQLVLATLYRVHSREPETVRQVRWVVRMLHGEETRVQLSTSKDRGVAGGRKRKAQVKKGLARAEEEQRRQAALATIRKQMAHTLRQRREKRAAEHAARAARAARSTLSRFALW